MPVQRRTVGLSASSIAHCPRARASVERGVARSKFWRIFLRARCGPIGARDLGVSVRTYRRYVASILLILEASSRPQAALLARERGWI